MNVSLALVKEQETLLRPIFQKYQGNVIKSTGDGFLAEFGSALNAARCAIEGVGPEGASSDGLEGATVFDAKSESVADVMAAGAYVALVSVERETGRYVSDVFAYPPAGASRNRIPVQPRARLRPVPRAGSHPRSRNLGAHTSHVNGARTS